LGVGFTGKNMTDKQNTKGSLPFKSKNGKGNKKESPSKKGKCGEEKRKKRAGEGGKQNFKKLKHTQNDRMSRNHHNSLKDRRGGKKFFQK